eukprot:4658179-Pyramimonas_sp.AAC.1
MRRRLLLRCATVPRAMPSCRGRGCPAELKALRDKACLYYASAGGQFLGAEPAMLPALRYLATGVRKVVMGRFRYPPLLLRPPHPLPRCQDFANFALKCEPAGAAGTPIERDRAMQDSTAIRGIFDMEGASKFEPFIHDQQPQAAGGGGQLFPASSIQR